MRIGFRTSPQNTDWASLEAAWAEAGRHEVFDSGWLNDHMSDPGLERGGPSFKSMTTLAALAHLVPGKAVGQTVLAATFRHPAMLAKEAVTMDQLTGGRYILALGAGWHAWEHEAFGIDLPPVGVRFDRFESTIRVLRALFGEAARERRASRSTRRPIVSTARSWSPVPSGRAVRRSGSAGRVRAACGWRRATPMAGTSPRTSMARRMGS